MASIVTPVTTGGSPSTPTTIPVTLPTALTDRWFPRIPMSSATWAGGFYGPIIANGVDQIRHVAAGSIMDTGLLAPIPDELEHNTAWSVTPNGARATATLDTNTSSAYTIAAGNVINIGGEDITFVADLTDSTANQVLLGKTGSPTTIITLDNLVSLLEGGTGLGKTYNVKTPGYFPALLSVVTKTDENVALRLNGYGAIGNDVQAYLKTGSWTNCDFGSQGATVGTIGYFESGSDGSGSTLTYGERRYGYRYYRSADGAFSAYDPLLEDDGSFSVVSKFASQDVAIADMRKSLDSDVDYIEWVRSLDGSKSVYPGRRFVDSATSDTDDLSDNDLVNDAVEQIRPSKFRPYVSGMIPKFRHVYAWKGRVWGGGAIRDEDYVGSAITWENGSRWAEVTSGVVTEDWIGKTIKPATGNDDYGEFLICSVNHEDDSNNAGSYVLLNKEWEGPDGGTGYTLEDQRNPFALYFSEDLLPNNFPPQNELTGIRGNDSEGITGITSIQDRLVVFTRSSMWVVTGEDLLSFSIHSISNSIGCVSGQTIIEAEGGIFWLAQDGVYAWSGVGKPEKISSPLTSGEQVSGIDATINRINWPHAHLSHARYCSRARIIEIFVPLDDEIIPEHGIVLDLGSRGVFSMSRGCALTANGGVQDEDGDTYCIAGDEFGNLWQMDVGDSDGLFGSDPVLDITTGSTTRVIETGTGSLSGVTATGLPAVIVAADGTLTFTRVE